MKRIVERDAPFGIMYEVYYDNERSPRNRTCIFHSMQMYDEFEYILLFNSDGKLIKPAYEYMNTVLTRASISKRRLALQALKVLYSFFELFGLNDKSGFDEQELSRFTDFLSGGHKIGNQICWECNTLRCNNTMNGYFTIYREFYKDILKIESPALHEFFTKQSASGVGFLGHVRKETIIGYNVNQKVLAPSIIPKYITKEEYFLIIDLIKKKYGLREEIIITLMYQYGLRIGEVLGLTIEDIEQYDTGDGRLILRNRLTDKRYQLAKGCMTIRTRSDYKVNKYWEQNVGYEVVEITKRTLNMINEYISETRGFSALLSKKRRHNLEMKNSADKVTDKDLLHNSYLIISKNYTPITSEGWNFILRNIFIELGIPLDKEKRDDNLNHRFRHGFAMYRVYFEKYSKIELADALRHSSTATVEVYFNPSPADKLAEAYKTENLLRQGGVIK